ncbi:MAG: hypothetical protein P4L10_12190 [Acidobacteriaceae bacterium]|nr:hypothetical protein [Acidobacteriaceae bacterium]
MAEDIEDDDMRPEYDFSTMKPIGNKYAARFAKGVKVRVLDENGNVLEEESRKAEQEIQRMRQAK